VARVKFGQYFSAGPAGLVRETDNAVAQLGSSGRVDDVINVAGHRLGTKELESAALMVDEVAEAAAVPVIDEVRGRAVEMYVSLKPGVAPSKDMADKVVATIETEIGEVAQPRNVWIVPDLPKTPSGKIMRRVIAAVSNFADVGDTTTLADPEIVDDIRHHVRAEKAAHGDVPRELDGNPGVNDSTRLLRTWRRRLSGRKRLSGRVLGISRVLAAHLCGTGAGRLSIAVVAAAAVLQALLILRFGHDARGVWLWTLVATCALTVSLGAVVTVWVPAVRAHTLELLAVLTRPIVLPSAITALGLSVRLIVPRGLWLDDMTSVYDARLPLSTMLHVLQTTDDHPPLYFSILWVAIRVFGDTEMSVRIPSIVIGTLVLPMLYLLGKEAYDRRTGAIAAVAGIAAPLMVWYSQEVRMYELLMLLGAIAMWAQVRILRVGPSWRLWTVYALCCAGLMWTQYFGSFQVIAQELVFCVVLFVRRHDGTSTRRLLLGFLLSSLAIAAILMPLVPFAHHQFLMGKAAGSTLGPQGPSGNNHLGIYTELANLTWAVWGYHSNATMVLLCSLWPLGMLFGHVLLGSQPRGITGLLLAGVIVPGLLLFALGRIEGSSLGILGLATNVRYLSTAVPLLFILIARVVTGVLHSKKLATFVTCALLVSLGAALIDQQYDRSNPRLYDFRGALLHIDKVMRPDDVLLYDGKLVELVKYYSPHVHARPLVSTPPLPSAGRTVYMIASPSLLYAANEDVLESALQAEQSRGRLARRLHYDNVEVWIFRER
jgi:uncharacterized membrane protein